MTRLSNLLAILFWAGHRKRAGSILEPTLLSVPNYLSGWAYLARLPFFGAAACAA
jgi:hypothetical protein